MKYVILLLNTEAARNMSEAEGQAWYAEIGAWYEKGGGGSGKLVETGHQLAPPATTTSAATSAYGRSPRSCRTSSIIPLCPIRWKPPRPS